MEQFLNRVEKELIEFGTREEKLEKLFPSDKVKERFVSEERMKHYSQLLYKFKGTKNSEELYLLERVRMERKLLEKKVYPNWAGRFLRKALSSLFKEKSSAAVHERKEQEQRERLLETVSRCGFDIAADKITANLSLGKESFSIPVSNYVTEKERMDHQLVFSKENSGAYRFDGFKAALCFEGSPSVLREHFFKAEDAAFTPKQAYQLLAGRSVEKDGGWIQFDLNDRNVSGCYRLKEFRHDYGFDLKNAIEALPLKDKSAESIGLILKGLKDGETPTAVFEVKGREYQFAIEANPQFRCVNIYDDHFKKINLSALRGTYSNNGKRKEQAVKTVKAKSRRTVRIG